MMKVIITCVGCGVEMFNYPAPAKAMMLRHLRDEHGGPGRDDVAWSKRAYDQMVANGRITITREEPRHPLSRPYGGVPEVGGYDCSTEYEVGAQRIAEAAHCILGSLHKVYTNPELAERYGGIKMERGHIMEEMRIIKRSIAEYSRPMYLNDLINGLAKGSPYAQESVATIPRTSMALEVTCSALRLDLPTRRYRTEPINILARLCYDVLIALAVAMRESIQALPVEKSAFWNPTLQDAVDDLGRAVDRFME